MVPAPITDTALADADAYAGQMGFGIGRCCEVLRLAPRGVAPDLMDGNASYSPYIETILRYLQIRMNAASHTAEVVACYVHTSDRAMTGVLGHADRVAMTRIEAEEVVLAGGTGWGLAEIMSDGEVRLLPAMTAAGHAAAVAERNATGQQLPCLSDVMPGDTGASVRPDRRAEYVMFEERPSPRRRAVGARASRMDRRCR